jgi:hypothetical protein
LIVIYFALQGGIWNFGAEIPNQPTAIRKSTEERTAPWLSKTKSAKRSAPTAFGIIEIKSVYARYARPIPDIRD